MTIYEGLARTERTEQNGLRCVQAPPGMNPRPEYTRPRPWRGWLRPCDSFALIAARD